MTSRYDEYGLRRLAASVVVSAVNAVEHSPDDYDAFHAAAWLEQDGLDWLDALEIELHKPALLGWINYQTARRSFASAIETMLEV